VPLLNIEDVTDATIVRQKASTAVAWVVKKHSSSDVNPLGEASMESFNTDKGEEKRRVIDEVDAGGVHYLESDEDLIQTDPSDIGNNLIVLLESQLRKAAVGVGLTYEILTGDLTKVNFSSIRAGMLDFRKRVEVIQNILIIGEGLQPIADMFQEFCSAWTSKDFSKEKISWYLPKKEGIDPAKDIKADIQALQGDYPLNTLKSVIESYGRDWDEYLIELEESKDAIYAITGKTAETNDGRTGKTANSK